MLVLLAAVVTGARAQWTGGTYTATANEDLDAITVNGDATLTINSDVTVTVTGGINVASGTLTVTGPGTLVVTGSTGSTGTGVGSVDTEGGTGGTGGVAISGNIIVQGGATVTATGGNGGNGGNGENYGGIGGTGGVAISGNIIVQGGATVTATGGTGGTGATGGWYGGNGGNGGNAFAGTLTYKSGTVTANGGSGGSGAWASDWDPYKPSSGSAGKAFANDVDFTQTTGYSVTNGTSTIGSVLNQTKVVISGGTPIPTGYSVSLKSDTDDATSWQGKAGEGDYQELPLTGLEAGTAVSVKYSGTKKVKSVKAKKAAPAPAPAATVTTAPTAKTGVKAGEDVAIVNEGTAEGGTMMYMVNATQPASTDGFSATVPTAEGLTAGTYYVWYYVKADDSHTDSEISATGIEVTIAAAAPAATVTTAPTAKGNLHAGLIIPLVTEGVADGGTMMYAVTTDNTQPASTDGFSATVPTAEGLTEACTRYVWYYVKADDTHTDSEISATGIEVTIAEPVEPTLANTLNTAGMTVKVNYNYNDEENYCLFLSNGNGTYTFQSGDGYAGGDGTCAKALVVEDGKLVFKQNFIDPIDEDWGDFGFSVTFDTSNNTYSEWKSETAAEEFNPSFISVEVNGATIAVTAAQ